MTLDINPDFAFLKKDVGASCPPIYGEQEIDGLAVFVAVVELLSLARYDKTGCDAIDEAGYRTHILGVLGHQTGRCHTKLPKTISHR